ncbi:hypothetical protein [Trichocoleus desertorum]|uniref:hypothetical protein n=1 Tax=Trichocoleus desertorum TaxID=1481672 RepID=UPI003D659DEE
MGATVTTATTVKAALKMAAEVHPNILISDLQLPDGDGCILLDTVRNLPSSSSKANPRDCDDGTQYTLFGTCLQSRGAIVRVSKIFGQTLQY